MKNIKLKKISVLTIDDDWVFGMILEKQLNVLGIQNVIVANGSESALELLEKENRKVDIIILDLEMPKMNGVSFLRDLRASINGNIRTVPVIILTGHSTDKVKTGMEPLGIQGFLGKPCSNEELESAIIEALQKEVPDLP
jgi:CheY-like chemotaxis protein